MAAGGEPPGDARRGMPHGATTPGCFGARSARARFSAACPPSLSRPARRNRQTCTSGRLLYRNPPPLLSRRPPFGHRDRENVPAIQPLRRLAHDRRWTARGRTAPPGNPWSEPALAAAPGVPFQGRKASPRGRGEVAKPRTAMLRAGAAASSVPAAAAHRELNDRLGAIETSGGRWRWARPLPHQRLPTSHEARRQRHGSA